MFYDTLSMYYLITANMKRPSVSKCGEEHTQKSTNQEFPQDVGMYDKYAAVVVSCCKIVAHYDALV